MTEKWYLDMLVADMKENGLWLRELTEELRFIKRSSLSENQTTGEK
jgi:hypothetical protein